jgi:ATP-binding cassette, subfamily B, bacterial
VNSKTIFGFILESFKPFRLWIMGLFMIAMIWAVDLSLRPYILKVMLDRISGLTPDNTISKLTGPASLYMSLSLLVVIVFRLNDFIWLNVTPPLKRHIGDTLMKCMMHHSQTLFQNHFAGNLANKIKDVMTGIPDLLKIFIQQFFSIFLALLSAIFMVWTINYKFAALLSAWVTIFVIGSIIFSKRAKELSDTAAEARSHVVGQTVDILSNITSVHLFSARRSESQKLRKCLDQSVSADQRRDWYFLGMFAFQGLSFVIYQVICLILLIYGFKNGQVSPGDFALILTVNIAIIHNLWSLSTDIMTFADLVGNITQGLRVALSTPEIQDKPNALRLQIHRGEIVFDKVRFHYKGAEPFFQNKSVTIHPGQKVGLVGYSGGGKTTFVNLILRLYDVIGGRVLIDGQDIREVTQDSLRSAIGMIPQDPSLFHRSLMENIRYGRIDASDKEVIEASRRAHAHEFISKLPHGYETLVGERGVKLSGGQRQRIAISRAILKNAPVLILDEATSQLDSVTESDIQESLYKLMQGKTTIVIAHRLSTLLNMDRILVFEQGKIAEDGTHQELLAKSGIYKTLWKAQVGGFLPDKRRMRDDNMKLHSEIV